MSDAKTFALKAPLTAEERLDEIERKYGVIQQRIQAYDEVLDQFAALGKQIKQSEKNTASLHDFCESFGKEIKASIANILAQIQPLKSVQESHARTLQGHGTSITSMLEHASNKYMETRESLDEMNNKLCNWATDHVKRKDLIDEVKRRISEISNQQSTFCGNLDKLYSDYFKYKERNDDFTSDLNEEIRKTQQSIAKLPDLSEWANKLYSRFTSDMAYREKQNEAYVDKKVDQLAQDFAANPLSAQSIRNELFNEIQALSLDSKNAYLKSNNCAQQIQLFEKKLENLNLIIKKYELNK